MVTHTSPVAQFAENAAVRVVNDKPVMEDAGMTLVAFIENNFIPNHVRLKSEAGRTHYQAILKHIIKPETVQTIFAQYSMRTKARLKAAPGWPYLDDLKLRELNADHVRQLTASALACGYSPQTVKHIKSVVNTIISHAQKEHVFGGDNPVAEIKLPRLVHATPRDMSIDEAKVILRMLRYPEREIALISMSTGLGASEICALRWKHVNLTWSTAWIDGELVPPHSIVFRSQQTCADGIELPHSRPRVVAIGESLTRELERLKRQRGLVDRNGFVIATPQGEPIQPTSARTQRLRTVGRKLKMPWLSWRALKRAHGALLSEMCIRLTDDLVRIAQSE